MENKISNIYSQSTVEFVTISAEFCIYLERTENRHRNEFVDVMRKMLSLLYLKTSTLPAIAENDADCYVEQSVSESDYEAVRRSIWEVMGEMDDYLDTFADGIGHSDIPIRRSVSEDLADIYQSIRNFVGVYKEGFEEAMTIALIEVKNQFEMFWGKTLLNTLRALHDAQFNQHIEFDSIQNDY